MPKNVGAIAEYLNRIVRHPSYTAAHKRIDHFLERFPRVGPELAQIGHKVEEAVKGIIVPSLLFEEFGLRYIGPVDGHNTQLLIDTLTWAKQQDVPVLIHILTKKTDGSIALEPFEVEREESSEEDSADESGKLF